MTSISFDIFCGNCFRSIVVPSVDGGSLLSCGDFLCKECASTKLGAIGCPVCGRQGVRAVFLNDALPSEVKRNISDPTKEFQNIYSTIGFQVRYYKELIRRLIERLQQLRLDNERQKSQIKELESNLKQKQNAPSFFSKDPDQRSDIFETAAGVDFFKSSRVEPPPSHPPSTRQERQDIYPRHQEKFYNPPSYPDANPYLPPPAVQLASSNYQRSRPPPVDYRSRQIPETDARFVVSRGVPSEPEPEAFRKRIQTPSRTIFSAQPNNQLPLPMNGATPSRIRSPHNQIVRSPSSFAFPQEGFMPTNAVYRSTSPRETTNRREQSPIASFLRQSYK